MLNFESEAFVIYYPHGAGGRFLQMLISLDPGMWGIDNQPKQQNIYNQYLATVTKNDRAHWFDGTIEFNNINDFVHADRYVFQFHNSAIEFVNVRRILQQIRKVYPIFISINDERSIELINRRRAKLNTSTIDVVGVSNDERTLCNWSESLCHHWLKVDPELTIDLANFWNPDKAKLILNNFFQSRNLNCEGWHELYNTWHVHNIAPYV
jgi:hypothetical protein